MTGNNLPRATLHGSSADKSIPGAILRSLPIVLAAFLTASRALSAQTDPTPRQPGAFTVPVYDEGSGRIIAVLHGNGRFDLKTSRQVLDTVQVDYRDALGQTNLVVAGKNCIYDFKSKTAVSPEPIRVATGDGRLQLQGIGFVWYQTNKNLVISNDVRTVVLKRAATATSVGKHDDDMIELRSQQFAFDHDANLLSYSGQVKLLDPQFEVACEKLTIRRSATNTLEQVDARGGVVVSNRMEHSITTAESASYILRDKEDRLELSGHPQWTDGVRKGEADRFDMDRRNNTLDAIGRARVIIPRTTGSGLSMMNFAGKSGEQPAASSSNTIEVTAEFLRIEPQPGSPDSSRYRFLAETNVAIVDSATGAKATAARAVFGDKSGLELAGSPVWTSGGRTLRAGALAYDVTTGAFTARTNVFVRFPLLSLVQSSATNMPAVAESIASVSTNDYMEIWCDEIAYRESRAVFRPSVKAIWRNEASVLGTLACAELGMTYSNSLEELDARGRFVFDREPHVRKDGTSASMHLECDEVSLRLRAGGVLDRIALNGNVSALISERTPKAAKPIEKQLLCDSLRVVFGSGSNLVEQAEARGGVVLRQDERSARAAGAQYFGSSGKLVLTGSPLIVLPEGTISGANEVSWEHATGRYTVSGKFSSRWKRLPIAANFERSPHELRK